MDITTNGVAPAAEHLESLQKYFGHGSFRAKQWEIISVVLDGRCDQLAVMATGSGKSLCYQFPAVHRLGLGVVVSPLISLMEDQVLALQLSGIPACLLGSAQTQSAATQQELLQGKFRLLYISPEWTVGNLDFLKLLAGKVGITLLAIDEAHCVSQWGHDFRGCYRQLHLLRTELPDVPILALTATATVEVRDDIIRALKLRRCRTTVTSFDRPNLYLEVRPKTGSALGDLTTVMQRVEKQWRFDGATIVYCPTRKITEVISTALLNAGVPCVMYHAGMALPQRKKAHEKFVRDKVPVIVATVAFGMGIDKPDVRRIVHYGASRDVESYYQEIGRAGRDGLPAQCTIFFKSSDFVLHRHFLNGLSSAEFQQHRLDMLNDFEQLLSQPVCRRAALLRHFDPQSTAGERAGCCDNCDNKFSKKRTANLDAAAPDGGQNFAAQAVQLMEALKLMKGRSGLSIPILFLRGSTSKRIWEWLKTKEGYGKGKDFTEQFWKSLGKMLIFEKYLEERSGGGVRGRGGGGRGRGGYGSFVSLVHLTPKGEEFLKAWARDRNTPLYLLPTEEMRGAQKPTHTDFAAGGSEGGARLVLPERPVTGKPVCGVTVEPPPDPAELKYRGMLYAELLALRTRLSDQLGVMPYMVASNRTLMELAHRRPSSVRQLTKVEGMTEVKAQKYGYEIVELISGAVHKHNLTSDNFPAKAVDVPDAEAETERQESLLLRLSETQRDTYVRVCKEGQTLTDVAAKRGLKESTLAGHLAEAIRLGLPVPLAAVGVDSALVDVVTRVVRSPAVRSDISRLSVIKEHCPAEVTYDQLKICLAVLSRIHGVGGSDKPAERSAPAASAAASTTATAANHAATTANHAATTATEDTGWLSSATPTTIVSARRMDMAQSKMTRFLPQLEEVGPPARTPQAVTTAVKPASGHIQIVDPFADDSDVDEADLLAATQQAERAVSGSQSALEGCSSGASEPRSQSRPSVRPPVLDKFRWGPPAKEEEADKDDDVPSKPLWGGMDPDEINARDLHVQQPRKSGLGRGVNTSSGEATTSLSRSSDVCGGKENVSSVGASVSRGGSRTLKRPVTVRPGSLLSDSDSESESQQSESQGDSQKRVKRTLPPFLASAVTGNVRRPAKKRSLFSK